MHASQHYPFDGVDKIADGTSHVDLTNDKFWLLKVSLIILPTVCSEFFACFNAIYDFDVERSSRQSYIRGVVREYSDQL